MESDARRLAQQRVDRIASFRRELTELEREGALRLTDDQRTGLEEHLGRVLDALSREFGADVSDAARRISWGVRVATVLGAAALGAALVLFLHRVWGYLPFPAQFGTLLLVPLGLLAGAAVADRRRIDPFQVGVLALTSGVTLGFAVDALGGVLNVSAYPHALLVIGVYGVLTGHAFRVRLLVGAGLFVVGAYLAALLTAAEGSHWEAWPMRAHYLLPAAALLYAVPWVTERRRSGDWGIIYRGCGAVLGLLALLLMSVVGHSCCGVMDGTTVVAGYQLAGLGLSAAVLAHGFRSGRGSLVNLGAAAFVMFLYVRLHAWWWDWMPKYLFFFLIGLIAFGLLLVFRRLRRGLAGVTTP
jgi:hypothetical protein